LGVEAVDKPKRDAPRAKKIKMSKPPAEGARSATNVSSAGKGFSPGAVGNATDVLKMLVWASCTEDAELSEPFELRFGHSASGRDVFCARLTRQDQVVDATDFAARYGVEKKPATLAKTFSGPMRWAVTCKHWRDGNTNCRGISIKPVIFFNDTCLRDHEELLHAVQRKATKCPPGRVEIVGSSAADSRWSLSASGGAMVVRTFPGCGTGEWTGADIQTADVHKEGSKGGDVAEGELLEASGDVHKANGNGCGGINVTENSPSAAAERRNDANAGRGLNAVVESCGTAAVVSSAGDAAGAAMPQIVPGLRDEIRNSSVACEGGAWGSKSAAAHGLLELCRRDDADGAGASAGKLPTHAEEVANQEAANTQDMWLAQQLQRLQVMHNATNRCTRHEPCTLSLKTMRQAWTDQTRVDWKRMYRAYLLLSVLSFGDTYPQCSLRPHHISGADSCCKNSHAHGCQSVFDREFEVRDPQDADAGFRADQPWRRQKMIKQKMIKFFPGDCTAIAGVVPQADHPRTRMQAPMEGPDGFRSGMHFFEITSKAVLQESGAESDRASFAVGLVSNSRRPGGIFLGSEPACGAAGFGFGYQGGRKQVMSTGCEPREYGCHFAAGDTVGVLLDADKGVISFFVNNVGQGIAFRGQDFKRMRCAANGNKQEWCFRPAVGLYAPGVKLSLRHRSATRHAPP
jgi:hypothetical protein